MSIFKSVIASGANQSTLRSCFLLDTIEYRSRTIYWRMCVVKTLTTDDMYQGPFLGHNLSDSIQAQLQLNTVTSWYVLTSQAMIKLNTCSTMRS